MVLGVNVGLTGVNVGPTLGNAWFDHLNGA